MPDFHSPEDEATLYVLGELAAAERAEFEARMAKSAELRQMVRELEEGMVVLATGAPRRRPPAELWSGIEKAVSRSSRPEVAWWGVFWRNGWAAAVLCLIGWLVYAIVLSGRNHAKTSAIQPTPVHETVAATTPPAPAHAASLPRTPTNGERQLLQVRAEEISDLQLRIAALAQETNDLSQLLALERARLGETNRLKLYQFTPVSAANGDAAVAPQLSPAMQRAVLISMGRELGLLPMSSSKVPPGTGHTTSTVGGIDFVDLRPPTGAPDNQPANPSPVPPATQTPAQLGNQPLGQPEVESQVADVTEPSIPAFVSGDKLVVGLDPSVIPINSTVTLSFAGTSYGVHSGSWDFVMGQNPTMVTLPGSTTSVFGTSGGGILTITTVTGSGISNISQFFAPANP